MSGYAQVTLRRHSHSAVVNVKSCRSASLYVKSELSSVFRLYHNKIPTIVGLAKVCPYANFCQNKSAHQLLGCAYFATCPGTLVFLHKM